MEVRHIDHVNIKIPDDEVDRAVEFYRDTLGLEPERLDAYRSGERTIFSFRLSPESILHVRPVDDFEPPSDKNFDHFAIRVGETVDQIKDRLADGDVDIERDGRPLGATGRAPAVYVRDPFGYLIEIKEDG